jgi:hypothetical protein
LKKSEGTDCLRRVELVLQRNEYIAGEIISGTLVVDFDEKLKCEKLDIILYGNFEQMTMASKSYIERKYTLTHLPGKPKIVGYPIYEDLVFSISDVEFDAGIQKIPVKIKLPGDIIPSCSMGNMGTGYNILCTMITNEKKNKQSKLHARQLIRILSPVEQYPGEASSAVDDSQEAILEITVPTQRICIQDRLSFFYKINSDMKFKELRAEIECTMKWLDSTGMNQMQKFSRHEQKTSSKVVARHERREITLFASRQNWNEQLPISVSSANLESSLVLKVSIVGGTKRGEITARIPIYVGHCLNPDWREEPERLYGNDPKLLLRGIPWARSPTSAPRRKPIKISKPVLIPNEERMAQNWYNRAVLYRDSGEIDEAIRSIEKALEWQPDSEQALALRDELKKLEN